MPWPHKFETALRAEEAVRAQGAAPATIAIVDGQMRVGLPRPGLKALARCPDAAKASTRDIPRAELRRLTGGTTVSAAMALANLTGVRAFATGEIGGVHKGPAVDIAPRQTPDFSGAVYARRGLGGR